MSTNGSKGKSAVRLTDSTLRDGSHAIKHQYTEDHVVKIAGALDKAGIGVIEVTHGDGLSGSTFNYGFGLRTDAQLVEAAVKAVDRAKIAVLVLPGLGTVENLREVHGVGAQVARVATHCTEADVSVQHFAAARELGMETVGFLMLSHRIGPDELAKQARIMADAGCQCVYVVDSAGALLPDGVRDRTQALVAELGSDWAWRIRSSRTRTAPGRSTARCAPWAPAPATRRPRSWRPCSS
jgi:4-hydroxy 2-oxovalerate aldolase